MKISTSVCSVSIETQRSSCVPLVIFGFGFSASVPFLPHSLAAHFLFRQEGKVTPTVNLFKGKRSAEEATIPFLEEEAQVEGSVLQGGEEEEAEEGETPEWLAEAIEQGAISVPDEGSVLDVPHRDVGQDTPFKF